MSVEEIIEFDKKLWNLVDKAYIADLWTAAHIVGCGCSDDGFYYFRAWLISQGREIYEKAVDNPESLTDVVRVGQQTQLELFLYVANDAYEKKTSEEEMPMSPRETVELKGMLPQDERALWARFPRLTQKFQNACDEIWRIMPNFTHYTSHVTFKPEKFTKATLFQSERLLLGLNCFEPGQAQAVHDHADQDKFYLVLEGEGEFVVGDETQTVGVGGVVLAPAGVPHGVKNGGTVRLVIFMGIAPGSSTHHH